MAKPNAEWLASVKICHDDRWGAKPVENAHEQAICLAEFVR
jgi:hypothetical protein